MKKLTVFMFLAVFCVFIAIGHSDIGPHPSMDLYVTYDEGPVPDDVFYSSVLDCEPLNKLQSNYVLEYGRFVDAGGYRRISGVRITNITETSVFWIGYDTSLLEEVPSVRWKLEYDVYDSRLNCYWVPYQFSWGGICHPEGNLSHCHFWYSIPGKFRVLIYLPSQNKTYVSSEVIRLNTHSVFMVNLLPDGSVQIKEITPL